MALNTRCASKLDYYVEEHFLPPSADLVIVNMYLCESLVTIGMNKRL